MPPALIVFGFLLLRNAPDEDDPGTDDPLLGVRLALPLVGHALGANGHAFGLVLGGIE